MISIYNSDCLEKMKDISSNSIDLIICDLPFGCLTNQPLANGIEGKTKGGKNYTAISGCSWDVKIDLEKFWDQIKRIRKDEHTPCLMFCTTKYGYELIKSNEKEFRYDLVWDKGRGVSFLSANKMPMRSHEMIYVFSKAGTNYYRKDIEGDFKEWKQFGKVKESGCYSLVRDKPVIREVGTITSTSDKRCIKSVINISGSMGKGKHPTEKPIDLYKFLIERYSKEGDKVLDPTFGSGNSGLACIELNRNYIGIEKDKIFFDKFKNKIISK